MVPFLDLKAGYDELADEIEAAILNVSRSGWYIGGQQVENFETAFANYTQAAYCVGTGNGLDALTLALRALNIGKGDEVIVPSHTFIATWLAVSAVGATIVPVEPDNNSYHINAENIKPYITPRTKAIIPVHLYGIPVDIEAICQLAHKTGIYVLEDAAQAHGATVNQQAIGAHGDIVAWSFYPGKNLGALGDGGAITTNQHHLADRVRKLANYGATEKYYHQTLGVNSRLDAIQASVLSIKLQYLDEWNQRRQAIAQHYQQAFADLPITLPSTPPCANPVWHLYVIALAERDALQQHLTQAGIQTLIHYPVPCHLQAAYAHAEFSHFPIAEKHANQVLSLPMCPQLSMLQTNKVIDAVRSFFNA